MSAETRSQEEKASNEVCLTYRANGEKGIHHMTYLKILAYARRGIEAEIDYFRGMQDKAIEGAGVLGEAHPLARMAQEQIDALKVDMATIDELQEIHDRK